MELNHLRYFHEVAKAGGFTQASRKLRISQSALSKAVALLEDHAGVKLLQRSKKGVALTAVGVDVFHLSTSVFQLVTDIENTCRGKKEVCEGPLRFGASDHVTNYLLADKLQLLRGAHPRVVPTVFAGTPNEILNQIFSSELEFGLFFTKVAAPGIVYQSLAPLKMTVVCHPKLLPSGKTDKAALRTLVEKHGFIGSIKAQYRTHPAQDFLQLAGAEPVFAFESNSQESQKRFCLAGGGLAFLAHFMVQKEIERGELVEIPTTKPLTLELWLAKKKGLPLSLNARTFLDSLKFVVS